MNPQDAWNAAFSQLEIQLDRASFETWLRGAVLLGYEDGFFRVGVRNDYARSMLEHRLYRSVRRTLCDVFGQPAELRFEVHTPIRVEDTASVDLPLFSLLAQQQQQQEQTVDQPRIPLHEQIARPQRPNLPDCELNPRFTFENFVVANSNQFAYAAAQAVATDPANAYNPLFIYGGVGLGKTHLLHAIGHVCHSRGQRVVYISSEAFTNDLIDAIRQRETALFREKYRSADVLLMDDVQFIAGKESTQEEFFHTFNALRNFGKHVVIVGDRHPRELDTLNDRLRSRFESGLIVDVGLPDLESRVAILQMWARERKMDVPRSVYIMMAERASTNLRELEGQFNQLCARTHLSTQRLTAENAEIILDNFARPREHVTLGRVLEVTAQHYNIDVMDLTGTGRATRINNARQVAIYLAREVVGASLPQIGEVFGGRSHSTILHSYNKIAAAIEVDDNQRSEINAVRDAIARR